MIRRLTVAVAVFALAGCGEGGLFGAANRAELGTDNSQYSFETGLQGWVKSGNKITSVATSTTQVFLGAQSMAVNISTTAAAANQTVQVATTAQLAGQTISYRVYLPTGIKLTSLQVYAQENASNGWRWNAVWRPASALVIGGWNTINLTVPSNAAPLQGMGIQFSISTAWTGVIYVDSIAWGGGLDAGTPVVDAGAPPVIDAGTPVVDAGSPPPVDAGAADAGSPPVEDAGSPPVADAGTPVVDAGTPPVVDAGAPPVVDAGTPPVFDAGTPTGPIAAIRFGGNPGKDGIFSGSPVDPNNRTVAGWVRFRVSSATRNLQEAMWTLENNAPSTAYQLMISTWHADQWESHDQTQGGFLFAPVDTGWWFIAESHRIGGNTTLYFKKAGAATLSARTGNKHPTLSGVTRFLLGTDDATGQNEWLDGDLAGIKVWNAELTQAELELEANQLAPVRASNLHAYYPLQSVDTMLLDASGNGRNLSPITVGGTWSLQSGPSIGGAPVADAGTPVIDAGAPPVVDAGSPPVVDAGSPPVVDAGAPVVDAGTPPVVDAGTPPSGAISAIRFGATAGRDGIFSTAPVDPNLRTVSAWVKLRVSSATRNLQETAWTLETPAPSTAYQLMITTWHTDQWETHDSAQGGFLFAPVDTGWWFIAEAHAVNGGTTLYFKKQGAPTLSARTGNKHPQLNGVTRFLVGTDDAAGQNEWLDGDIAGVKVWNAELTQAELEAEANQLSPVRQTSLHAYYPLQSVATMFDDASGNGRGLTPITSGGSWSVQVGPAINP